MSRLAVPVAAVLVVGLFYWELVRRWSGVTEPWDAPAYWSLAYPGALLLSASAVVLFRRRAWVAGAAIVLAQLPVILWHGGSGPLLAAGLFFLGMLSLPAMAAAALAGRVARRFRPPPPPSAP